MTSMSHHKFCSVFAIDSIRVDAKESSVFIENDRVDVNQSFHFQ